MSGTGDRLSKINEFFREHRLKRGLSIKEVAHEAGIDQTLLIRIENSVQPIPLDLIFTLTIVLNIPADDVLNLVFDTYRK